MKTLTIAAAGIALAVAGHASATTYQYASNTVSGNHAGGQMDSVITTFNTVTNQFTWSITFSNQITEGFTLAVSPGENPKNNPGQLAMLYFDASDASDVQVSAYGYNGLNSLSSFTDGNGAQPGQQTADFISGTAGSAEGSWVTAATVTDDDLAGTRTMSLTIDATDIQGHTPMYPDPVEPWTGVSFGEKIGFWFHTFTDLQTSYAANGQLLSWGYGAQGWSDRSNLPTVTIIPLPPAAWAGLVGLAGATVMRRRLSA